MRRNTNGKVTLAIGDGANDVNMIQKAHVGFGIMGKEGNQAAAFSDYAIANFQDLRRVLFWHGRPYGNRMVNFLRWCLLKDMLVSAGTFCMQWYNGFSGFTPIDGLMFSLYDVALTTIFFTISSIFDHDLSYSADEKTLPYTMSSLFAFSR